MSKRKSHTPKDTGKDRMLEELSKNRGQGKKDALAYSTKDPSKRFRAKA